MAGERRKMSQSGSAKYFSATSITSDELSRRKTRPPVSLSFQPFNGL